MFNLCSVAPIHKDEYCPLPDIVTMPSDVELGNMVSMEISFIKQFLLQYMVKFFISS